MKKPVVRLLDNISEVGLLGNSRLAIFKDNPLEAMPTDMAILSGATRDSYGFTPYWTTTSAKTFVAVITSKEYSSNLHHEAARFAKSPAIRPVIEIDSIEDKSIIHGDLKKDKIVTMGEYPLFIEEDEDLIIELDRIARLNKTYMKTNKVYHLDDKNRYQEYVFNEKKYVRFKSKNDGNILSNNKICFTDKDYWLKVSPVPYYVDNETGLLISVYGLLSGIRYWPDGSNESNFEESNMNYFLNETMVNDLLMVSSIRKVNDYSAYLQDNPFNLQNKEISYSDLARELIKSGISPFFHGDTGVGKSARVLQIDPKAKVIYLCNQSLDSINGKSVYIPPVVKREGDEYVVIREGMMQDKKPTWLKSFEEITNADDDMHLLFFDEITNAPLAIQGFCFNIILDREVNGMWKLPRNAGVAAAGNEIDESISANELAEPLFSRFGHIYISDNLKEWLDWAVGANIHPAIIAYMTYTNGINLLTKYNGITPNADPRKWEIASKALYATKNVSLLNGLIGEEVTKSFIEFCRCKTISLADVIAGNYDENDLIMDTNKKFVTARALSSVDMDNFETVYNFMLKVGEEPCALFESLWARNNEERLTKLREIKEYRRTVDGGKRQAELEQRVNDYNVEKLKEAVKKLGSLG